MSSRCASEQFLLSRFAKKRKTHVTMCNLCTSLVHLVGDLRVFLFHMKLLLDSIVWDCI